MLLAILSFFGFLFSWITNAMIMMGLGLGAVFWVYSQDLPNYSQLLNYEPPTLSVIFSRQGRIIDEFARKSRRW